MSEDHERGPTSPTTDALGATLAATQDAPLETSPRTDVAAAMPAASANRYSIVGEVGHGGIGRILEAEDRTLKRRVAIKELRVANRGRARLVREAIVTARLQHPSIVPLYDAGTWNSGEPYYSMRLVSGRPLDAVIAATKTLDERLALLPHVIAVADAMAYAHNERIIHRDLKPANVLVGDYGETVVIDWGLAKDLSEVGEPDVEGDGAPYRTNDAPAALTQAGEVLGTPVYMSPEQAMGKALDQRTDVYAIGAILYELLTGVWPHRGASSAQVIQRLIDKESITPVDIQQPDVPAELVTIVNRAMSHERDARYPSAAELAAELRRFQTGQLVAAHRYSRSQLVRRWLRRHRAAVAVAAVMVAALSVAIAVGVHSVVRERDATRTERDRLILAQASAHLERDPTAAIAWLKRYPADGTEPGRARELALQARARGVAMYVLPRDTAAAPGQFSPDNKRFAQPHASGLYVVDLATGTRVGPRLPSQRVEWAHDGRRLLVNQFLPNVTNLVDLADNRTTTIQARWSTRYSGAFVGDEMIVATTENELMKVLPTGATGGTASAPFAIGDHIRDNDRFFALSPEGVPTWWSIREGTAHPLALPAGAKLDELAMTVRFLGADHVAAGTTDGRVCIWKLSDGSLRVVEGDGAPLVQLAASRDGSRVVTLAQGSILRTIATGSGTSTRLPSPGVINAMTIAPDGLHAVVGMQDHRVLVVDARSGDLQPIGIHPGPVTTVAISADNRWIASDGNEDGSTRLWHLTEGVVQLAQSAGAVGALALAPDGRTVAALGVRSLLWNGDQRVELPAGDARSGAFDASGSILVTGHMDHAIRTWDVKTHGSSGPPLTVAAGMVREVAMSRTGGWLVSLHDRGDLRIWDLASRTSRLLATVPEARAFAMFPDERTIAIGGASGELQLVHVDGSPTTYWPAGGPIMPVAVAPDGHRVVAGTTDGRILTWDVATGTMRELGRQRGIVIAVAIDRDGRRVAAGSMQGDLSTWDLESGHELRLAGHTAIIMAVAFAGDQLASGSADGSIRLWDRAGETQTVIHLDAAVNAMKVRANELIAGTLNGTIVRVRLSAPALATLDQLTHARASATSPLGPPP